MRVCARSLVCLIAMTAIACGGELPAPERPSMAVTEVLAGDATGFARADRPRDFAFPRDHGLHPEFRTEWWYFTGHLQAADGREFGFQVTFFRSALSPVAGAAPPSASTWRTNDIWMAHLALGDFSGGEFRSHERFARGAMGLAGASDSGLEVWLENWRVSALRPDDPLSPVRLVAVEDDLALDLLLEPIRPPLLQGDEGLSQKGSQPGNASYYYSMTRWQAAGTLGRDGETLAVGGSAWMDREWSSSALEPGQVGWDWFSLQLDDGSDLMLYLMRRVDGSIDATSGGSWLSPTGEVHRLGVSDFALRPAATWTSGDGIQYPSAWSLAVDGLDLELSIVPLLADQELHGAFRYWEGGVSASGTRGGRAIGGRGFVELTGY